VLGEACRLTPIIVTRGPRAEWRILRIDNGRPSEGHDSLTWHMRRGPLSNVGETLLLLNVLNVYTEMS